MVIFVSDETINTGTSPRQKHLNDTQTKIEPRVEESEEYIPKMTENNVQENGQWIIGKFFYFKTILFYQWQILVLIFNYTFPGNFASSTVT